MSVSISKKAELFFKALEDIWVAEQIWRGSPNNAAWHCTQAVEKIMKGFLRARNEEYEHGHDLKIILDFMQPLISLTPETIRSIMYFDDFLGALRYKNMTTDPTASEAHLAITRAKEIMQEFRNNPAVTAYMKEADEVHDKMIKAISEV